MNLCAASTTAQGQCVLGGSKFHHLTVSTLGLASVQNYCCNCTVLHEQAGVNRY